MYSVGFPNIILITVVSRQGWYQTLTIRIGWDSIIWLLTSSKRHMSFISFPLHTQRKYINRNSIPPKIAKENQYEYWTTVSYHKVILLHLDIGFSACWFASCLFSVLDSVLSTTIFWPSCESICVYRFLLLQLISISQIRT